MLLNGKHHENMARILILTKAALQAHLLLVRMHRGLAILVSGDSIASGRGKPSLSLLSDFLVDATNHLK